MEIAALTTSTASVTVMLGERRMVAAASEAGVALPARKSKHIARALDTADVGSGLGCPKIIRIALRKRASASGATCGGGAGGRVSAVVGGGRFSCIAGGPGGGDAA